MGNYAIAQEREQAMQLVTKESQQSAQLMKRMVAAVTCDPNGEWIRVCGAFVEYCATIEILLVDVQARLEQEASSKDENFPIERMRIVLEMLSSALKDGSNLVDHCRKATKVALFFLSNHILAKFQQVKERILAALHTLPLAALGKCEDLTFQLRHMSLEIKKTPPINPDLVFLETVTKTVSGYLISDKLRKEMTADRNTEIVTLLRRLQKRLDLDITQTAQQLQICFSGGAGFHLSAHEELFLSHVITFMETPVAQVVRTSAAKSVPKVHKIPFKELQIEPRPIGSGKVKLVHRGKWDEQEVAVLSLRKGGYEVDPATFALLGRHKHLIRSFGVSTPPGGNEGTDDLLVVELARMGSLDKYFDHHGLIVDQDGTKNVTDMVLLRVAMQVCDAMIFMAKEGVVHRDIALRNVLVFAFDPQDHRCVRVKLADHSLTKEECYFSNGSDTMPIRWMPPKEGRKQMSSDKSDVWAFGVLLWELWTLGETPFSHEPDEDQVMEQVKSGSRLRQPAGMSKTIYTLMLRCWALLAKDRPTFIEVQGELFRLFSTEKKLPASSVVCLPKLPSCFLCPVTRRLMVDPAIDANEHTFERKAIEEALIKRLGVSPVTGACYRHGDAMLQPNRTLADMLDDFYLTPEGETFQIEEERRLLKEKHAAIKQQAEKDKHMLEVPVNFITSPGPTEEEMKKASDEAERRQKGGGVRRLSTSASGRLIDFSEVAGETSQLEDCGKLTKAASAGDMKGMIALLASSSSVNSRDAEGNSPLHHAALNGRLEMCQQLVVNFANLDIQNLEGKTPLDLALSRNHKVVVECLRSRGCKTAAQQAMQKQRRDSGLSLNSAAQYGKVELMRNLLMAGDPVTHQDEEGRTPLHHAASGGHDEACQVLKDMGAELDCRNKDGSSALHEAAKFGHTSTCKLLIQAGATVDLRDLYGNSPLYVAVESGGSGSAVVWLLLEEGASVNAQNDLGWTPLHSAAYNGRQAAAEALLKLGAKVDSQTNRGNTPLDYAISKREAGVEAVLRAKGGHTKKQLEK